MAVLTLQDSVQLQTTHEQTDIEWLDAAKAPQIKLYGAAETDPCYRRVPAALEPQLRPALAELCSLSSGIRARFKTNSPYILLHIQWDKEYLENSIWHGMRCFDLFSVHDGKQAFEALFRTPLHPEGTQDYSYKTCGDLREFLLNWPLYNRIFKVYIGLQAGSVLEQGGSYYNELPVVFYGSSITQGAYASRPGNSYENILSRALNMDYVNLGFSGNCLGDIPMVDYMTTLPMSCFVCDYDHNSPNAEFLEKTHFEVYRRIREKHPELPFVMVTRPDYMHRDAARRCVVMDSYQKARAAGDQNIYFIDGAAFYSGEERDACTFDGIHPNDLGLYRMAQGMVHTLRRILYGGGLY